VLREEGGRREVISILCDTIGSLKGLGGEVVVLVRCARQHLAVIMSA
jgi:hypothetical protein